MSKKSFIMKTTKILLIIALAILSIISIYCINRLNVVPEKYLKFIFLSCSVFIIICGTLLIKKGKIKNIFGIILSLLLICGNAFAIIYSTKTQNFLDKTFEKVNYKTESYYVVVLSNSSYSKVEDLADTTIGHLETVNRTGLEETINNISDEITFEEQNYGNSSKMLEELVNEEVSAFIIEESELMLLKEEQEDIEDVITVIGEYTIDVEIKDITKEVDDITNTPFNVYISGIDVFGKITNVSRSDVNIVVTVNPATKQVLLTSIPRDYYVTLAGFNGKDKLTHAGMYGIETSVGTLEDLLDIDINYYVKVNFTSVIDIVDTLGGVEIESPYSFRSRDGYYYKKGLNKLNGVRALSFVRERKALPGGDRTRGKNQELVLTALINKAMSPSIITKYTELLEAIEGKFITNMDIEDITTLIKKEIDAPSSWNIESISLDGYDASEYTYSYSGQKLYVMKPDEKTVIEAQKRIKKVIDPKYIDDTEINEIDTNFIDELILDI